MVEKIVIYPVKSLGGTLKTSWHAGETGFEYDRNWMLVNPEQEMLTQRDYPMLCTLRADVEDGLGHIHAEKESISWPVDEYAGKEFTTSVWDDKALVVEASKKASAFLSDFLHTHVLLVRQTGHSPRFHRIEKWEKDIPVSLADGYPYLVVGTQSVTHLNQQLDTDLGWNRFRPNIVVQTNTAHEEDEYDIVQLGEARFKNVKPCARCQVITIEQETGNTGKEPLKTLSAYRKKENKVFFGTNMMNIQPGLVSIGDLIRFVE